MKISEMTNDQATDAMLRLAGPFSNICDDEEALALIDKFDGMKGMKMFQAVGKILPDFVAFGLKKHKQDLYEIVGALLMEPTAKVGKMNFAATIKAIRDSYDDILAGFFTRSAAAEKLKEKESASS